MGQVTGLLRRGSGSVPTAGQRGRARLDQGSGAQRGEPGARTLEEPAAGDRQAPGPVALPAFRGCATRSPHILTEHSVNYRFPYSSAVTPRKAFRRKT